MAAAAALGGCCSVFLRVLLDSPRSSVDFSCSNRTFHACLGAAGADRGVAALDSAGNGVAVLSDPALLGDARRRSGGDSDESILDLF